MGVTKSLEWIQYPPAKAKLYTLCYIDICMVNNLHSGLLGLLQIFKRARLYRMEPIASHFYTHRGTFASCRSHFLSGIFEKFDTVSWPNSESKVII